MLVYLALEACRGVVVVDIHVERHLIPVAENAVEQVVHGRCTSASDFVGLY